MPIQDVVDALPTWGERGRVVTPYHNYYRGKQQLRFATADFRKKYGQVVAGVMENICQATVTGFTDEIEIESWDGDALDDALVADLERLSNLVYTEMLRSGDAFVIVAERADGSRLPVYQPADTVVPVVSDDDPTRLERAVKLWVGKDRHGYATVYYADRLERFRTTGVVRQEGARSKVEMPLDPERWAEFDPAGDGESSVEFHNMGAVPVVWFKFDPDDHWGWGNSILANVIPIQDLLNKVTADLAVLAESYSRPLYYVLKMKPADMVVSGSLGQWRSPAQSGPYLGLTPALNPDDPLAKAITNGTPSELGALPPGTVPGQASSAPRFNPTSQQIMAIDGEGPVGQFTPADIEKLITMRADLRQSVSNVTGLPSYVFIPTGGDVPSGESLKVVSRRQAAVVRRATRPTVPLWRGVMELLGLNATPVFRDVNESLVVAESDLTA